MKIPKDQVLIGLPSYFSGDYVYLLDFLKEKLPFGISIEDVVLTTKCTCTDPEDPEGRSNVFSLELGYLVPEGKYRKDKRLERIKEEEQKILNLEKELVEKKKKLEDLKK